MTREKSEVFPISLFGADDRAGRGGKAVRGGRGSGGGKNDYRKGSLRNVPLLSQLSDSGLARLEAQSQRTNFSKGQEIIGRADQTSEVFILLSGQARVIFYSAGGRAVAFRR